MCLFEHQNKKKKLQRKLSAGGRDNFDAFSTDFNLRSKLVHLFLMITPLWKLQGTNTPCIVTRLCYFRGLITKFNQSDCSIIASPISLVLDWTCEWSTTITLEAFLVGLWPIYLKELAFTYNIPFLFLPTLFPFCFVQQLRWKCTAGWRPSRIAHFKFATFFQSMIAALFLDIFCHLINLLHVFTKLARGYRWMFIPSDVNVM